MRQCAGYHQWCSAVGDNMPVYCTITAQDLPPMTMWFHQRIDEIVLGLQWIPRTKGGDPVAAV